MPIARRYLIGGRVQGVGFRYFVRDRARREGIRGWVRLARLREPAVLFVHPWEFVDLRRERLRFDCRFRTGRAAEECLRSAVRRLRRDGAMFTLLRDMPAALGR
jgi:hypothetical protein